MAATNTKIWLSIRLLESDTIEAKLRHPKKESTITVSGENVADLLKATLAASCALLKRSCAIECAVEDSLIANAARAAWVAELRKQHRAHAWQVFFLRPTDMRR